MLIERERRQASRRPPVIDPALVEEHVRMGVGQGPPPPTRLERLVAGEPVVVSGWDILAVFGQHHGGHHWPPKPWPCEPNDHVRVERNGRLTIVEPIFDPADPLSSTGWKERS